MVERKRIFIVDDDPDIVFLFKRRLVAAGYEIFSFGNGADAVKAALTDPPALILLDILMPKMNGYEVCRRLKGDARTSKVPILLLSALSDSASRLEAEKAGGDVYLTKPIEMQTLLDLIRRYIRC